MRDKHGWIVRTRETFRYNIYQTSENQEVNLSVLFKIVSIVDCNAGEMMDFIKDNFPAEGTES